MKRIKIIITGLVAAASLSTAIAVSAQNDNAKCSVDAIQTGSRGSTFNVKDNKVSVTFEVKGFNCITPVTLAVWERPTAEGINDQKLFNYVANPFFPGTYTLSSKLPQCRYQVYLIEGANPTAADGTANYQYQNGQSVDGGLRDSLKGSSSDCDTETPETASTPEEPESPATPDTPETPDAPDAPEEDEPVAPETPSNTEGPESPSTPESSAPVTSTAPWSPEKPNAPVAEVKTLPNTGPGSILASTVGLSTSTGLAYNLILSRRKLK